MNKVQYYGNGPVENYTDRQSGARIGIYNTTAEDMYFPLYASTGKWSQNI